MAVLAALLDTLVPSARTALPYVRSLVEQGASSTVIQKTLSDAGMGVRRTDLLALIRGLKDEELSRPYVDSLRMDVLPNPERLPFSVTATLRDYSYQVELTGTHLETGELFTQNLTISTTDLLTKGQAVAQALEIADANLQRYGFSAHEGFVRKVTRSA